MEILEIQRINDHSLKGFKDLNEVIFGFQNQWFFSAPRMVSRMNRHAVSALKAIMADEQTNSSEWKSGCKKMLAYRLAMTFSWSLGLANKLNIDLEEQRRRKFVDTPFMTLQEFQRMIGTLIIDRSAMGQVKNLLVDIVKVDESVEVFLEMHDLRLLGEVGDKLLNVISRTCEVANLANLNLADEMQEVFGEGCPKCLKTPCGCPFTVSKTV